MEDRSVASTLSLAKAFQASSPHFYGEAEYERVDKGKSIILNSQPVDEMALDLGEKHLSELRDSKPVGSLLFDDTSSMKGKDDGKANASMGTEAGQLGWGMMGRRSGATPSAPDAIQKADTHMAGVPPAPITARPEAQVELG